MILSAPAMTYTLIALIVIVLAMIAWLVILHIRLARMTRQYNLVVTGVDGKNLEEILNQHIDEVRTHVETVAELKDHTRQIDCTLQSQCEVEAPVTCVSSKVPCVS